jgi:hypothetical protein
MPRWTKVRVEAHPLIQKLTSGQIHPTYRLALEAEQRLLI